MRHRAAARARGVGHRLGLSVERDAMPLHYERARPAVSLLILVSLRSKRLEGMKATSVASWFARRCEASSGDAPEPCHRAALCADPLGAPHHKGLRRSRTTFP